MFRTRKLDIDAAGYRPGAGRDIDLKKVGSQNDGRVSVHTIASGGRRRSRIVPEDYRKLERGRQGGWGFLIFLFVLFVAAIGAFYYWNNQPPQFQGDSVILKVVTKADVISGDEIVYDLTYENKDLIPLKSVELDVQWPEGFYYNDSTEKPLSENATTWMLGPLDPGQQKHVTIKGQLVGLKGQKQTAVFRLSYRPDNINADFEVKEAVDTLISDAQIDVVLTSPDKVMAGQQVEFKAEVSNLTTGPLTDMNIELIVPKDIDIISIQPALIENHWKGTLGLDKPLTLIATAKVADDADGAQSWALDISQVTNDKSRRLLHKELSIVPVKPDVSMELKINGQGSDFNAEYGQTLNYQLKVTNKGVQALKDLKISALMDSDIIDRKTVQSNGVASNDSIVWTKDNIPELSQLEAGQEVLIVWKATLLAQGTAGKAAVDNVIKAELEGLQGWHVSSPVFVVSVGQGLVFNQNLYWNLAGEKVGSGNLPPITNERTVYLAVWSLDSGNQDFDTVNISSVLPDKVTFVQTDEADEGTLKYDQDANRLEWQINNFSSKLLPLKVSFYVKLVPRDEDKGTIMNALNPATIVASGSKEFTMKSFGVTTQQVITTETGDFGTVIE